MAKKATSAKVSKLAAKLIHCSNVDPDVRATIHDAVTSHGLALNDRCATGIVDRVIAALEPHFDDVRTLAASCLSQDETGGDDEQARP